MQKSVEVGHKLRLKSPCDSPSDAINPPSCKPLPSRTDFIALKLACYNVDVIGEIFAKISNEIRLQSVSSMSILGQKHFSKDRCPSVTNCMISKKQSYLWWRYTTKVDTSSSYNGSRARHQFEILFKSCFQMKSRCFHL